MAKVVSERDARIIALKHQELTSTQIAAAVGCTRNVVISVLHRYAPELTKSLGLVAEKPAPVPKGTSYVERRVLREAATAERAELRAINADVSVCAKMVDDGRPIRTLFDRCDELHARMDRVLAETRVK